MKPGSSDFFPGEAMPPQAHLPPQMVTNHKPSSTLCFFPPLNISKEYFLALFKVYSLYLKPSWFSKVQTNLFLSVPDRGTFRMFPVLCCHKPSCNNNSQDLLSIRYVSSLNPLTFFPCIISFNSHDNPQM